MDSSRPDSSGPSTSRTLDIVFLDMVAWRIVWIASTYLFFASCHTSQFRSLLQVSHGRFHIRLLQQPRQRTPRNCGVDSPTDSLWLNTRWAIGTNAGFQEVLGRKRGNNLSSFRVGWSLLPGGLSGVWKITSCIYSMTLDLLEYNAPSYKVQKRHILADTVELIHQCYINTPRAMRQDLLCRNRTDLPNFPESLSEPDLVK